MIEREKGEGEGEREGGSDGEEGQRGREREREGEREREKRLSRTTDQINVKDNIDISRTYITTKKTLIHFVGFKIML